MLAIIRVFKEGKKKTKKGGLWTYSQVSEAYQRSIFVVGKDRDLRKQFLDQLVAENKSPTSNFFEKLAEEKTLFNGQIRKIRYAVKLSTLKDYELFFDDYPDGLFEKTDLQVATKGQEEPQEQTIESYFGDLFREADAILILLTASDILGDHWQESIKKTADRINGIVNTASLIVPIGIIIVDDGTLRRLDPEGSNLLFGKAWSHLRALRPLSDDGNKWLREALMLQKHVRRDPDWRQLVEQVFHKIYPLLKNVRNVTFQGEFFDFQVFFQNLGPGNGSYRQSIKWLLNKFYFRLWLNRLALTAKIIFLVSLIALTVLTIGLFNNFSDARNISRVVMGSIRGSGGESSDSVMKQLDHYQDGFFVSRMDFGVKDSLESLLRNHSCELDRYLGTVASSFGTDHYGNVYIDSVEDTLRAFLFSSHVISQPDKTSITKILALLSTLNSAIEPREQLLIVANHLTDTTSASSRNAANVMGLLERRRQKNTQLTCQKKDFEIGLLASSIKDALLADLRAQDTSQTRVAGILGPILGPTWPKVIDKMCKDQNSTNILQQYGFGVDFVNLLKLCIRKPIEINGALTSLMSSGIKLTLSDSFTTPGITIESFVALNLYLNIYVDDVRQKSITIDNAKALQNQSFVVELGTMDPLEHQFKFCLDAGVLDIPVSSTRIGIIGLFTIDESDNIVFSRGMTGVVVKSDEFQNAQIGFQIRLEKSQ